MKSVGAYYAKTHLPALLDSVQDGEVFVITRNGRPAARLVPVIANGNAKEAVAAMKAFRKKHKSRLKGISIRELIEDGRRY